MAAITAAVIGAGTAVSSAWGARKAAKAQQAQGERAIQSQEAAAAQAREDLQPFTQFGLDQRGRLGKRLSQPVAQFEGDRFEGERFEGERFEGYDPTQIKSDPLFNTLFGEAAREIRASNAAKGKLDSGDTLRDLTNASMGIGADIYNMNYQNRLNEFNTNYNNRLNEFNINNNNRLNEFNTNYNNRLNEFAINQDLNNRSTQNLFNAVTMGQNAAAGQGTATLNTGNNISDLQTQIGNVQGARYASQANSIASGLNNAVGLYDFLKNQ